MWKKLLSEPFATAFARLKLSLDDPNITFSSQQMVDDLHALIPKAPDAAALVKVHRELAIVLAKQDDPGCLDYGEKVVLGQQETQALSDSEMYQMHLLCWDTGMLSETSPRVLLHLEESARLHPITNKPIGQLFAIRMKRAVFAKVKNTHRRGLDLMIPLLADAEEFYGKDNPELAQLLSQMAHAFDLEGDTSQAAALRLRRVALLNRSND